jgi:predicted nucleic acid-binding protein
VGELACGSLANRAEILILLQALPMSASVEHKEAMRLIEDHALMGKGLGYIDVHLLASAMLSDVQLWTEDKKLHAASRALGRSY